MYRIFLIVVAAAPAFVAAAQEDAPVFPLRPGWRLVQPSMRSGAWAAAVAVDAPAPPDLPRSVLFMARREADGWRVRSSDMPDVDAFDAWLDAAPAELLSVHDRAWFRTGGVARAGAPTTVGGHRLPVPGGWTALMTQGPFGPFSHSRYWAIDLVLPYWGTYTSTIVATKPGVVIYVKDVSDVGGLGLGYSGYANGVVIRHDSGEYSWYWHLAHGSVSPDVQPGQRIEAGAAIGRMGSTGYSSGAHLHFHVTTGFAMAGCDAVRGCPGRETRIDFAPWNRDIGAVDFEETADESTWIGCDSVAQCGDLPPSANRLDASDGAVAYWATDFAGPGWKMRAPFAGNLPGWLAGRARSLTLPAGWRATLFDQPDLQGNSIVLRDGDASLVVRPRSMAVEFSPTEPTPSATPGATPSATPGATPSATPSATPGATPGATPIPLPAGRQLTKTLRSDLAGAWPYLLGSANGEVTTIEVDGRVSQATACGWAVQSLGAGVHVVTFTLSSAVTTTMLEAHRWPFAAPACVEAPAQPGPMPLETPCYDASDMYEPNGDRMLATLLRPGDTLVHRAALAGDVDWATFTTTKGSYYVLETIALGSAADTVLELIGVDGDVVLARSDDAAGTGYASQISWQAPASGVQFARVRQWDPGAVGCGTNYELRLREMQPRAWVAAIMGGDAAPTSAVRR